ncbi:MAG: glycosyltransferase family 2 protein [Rhodospirillales bacterium]
MTADADQNTPQIRVIVVNYNAGEMLKRCLEALACQTIENFEAVVVDNASKDGSLVGAVPDDRRFSVIELDQNTGFAAANNRGAGGCRAPWIATLNPDAFAEPDWLEKLLDAARRYPGTAMFGSTQIDANNEHRTDGSGDALFATGLAWRGNHGHPIDDLPEEGETFGPCAAAAMYRTEDFNAAGGFDERFFCYLEDVDLAFRIRLMGGRCVQVRDAVVRHVGSAISGRTSDFARYHSARNGIWLFAKNMPDPLFWILTPFHAAMQAALLLWAAMRGHPLPVLRGQAAGIKGAPEIWRARRKIQEKRRAPWTEIARVLTWSPFKLLRRDHDVRPLG